MDDLVNFFNPDGQTTINTNADRIILIQKNGKRSTNWMNKEINSKIQYYVIVDQESGKKNYVIYLLHYVDKTIFVLLKFRLTPNELVISENFSEQFILELKNKTYTIGDTKTNQIYSSNNKIPHLTIHKDGNIFITFHDKNSKYKKPIQLKKKLILSDIQKPERLLILFPNKEIFNYKNVADNSQYVKRGIFFGRQTSISNSVIEIGILPHKSTQADGYLMIDKEENKNFLEECNPINSIVMKSNLLKYQVYLKLFSNKKENQNKIGWFFQ